MLMHVRIRENVYILSDFKTDWCESPISKENFCKLYKLNKDACDFYGDTGELITGDILDCEQVTVLQRPTGGAEWALGLAIASFFVSVGVTVYAVSKARRMSEELAKRQKSSSAVYSYSLRGSTNDKRNNCPIPIILGKVNATGDKAGLQYSTYSTDNFQDVHQILCLGYSGKDYNENAEVVPVTVETGDPNTPMLPVGGVVFDKSDKYVTPNKNQKEGAANPLGYIVRIADSPVDTFDGMYVSGHVGEDPLGTDNNPSYYTERAIEISTMMELKGDPDTEHSDSSMDFEQFSQTSPHNTTDIYVGIYAPYGYYRTNDDGEKEPASFAYTVQWRAVGSDTWNTASIPGVPGTMNRAMYRNMVHISVPFVEGENNQYEVRVFRPDYEHYYEFDSESGQWRLADAQNCITLSTEVIKFVTRAANNNITGPAGDEKYRHTWPIPYPARYSLLTMKARATDRTNGWLDQVYTEVHLKCRTYNDTPENMVLPCSPTMWTIPDDADTNIGTMNNPASVLLYVLTCPQINPHPVKYNQIDWESLRSWWWFCAGRDPNTGEIIYGEDGEPVRNWACNAFITSTMTVAELCELICATGRAHLVMSDNKYSIYIEDKTNVITQIFTPRNAWNMVETKSFDDPVTLIKTSFVDEDTEVEENRLTYFQLDPETGKVDIEDGKATILFDDAEEVLLQEDIYKSESMDIWGVTRSKQVAQLTAYNLYKGYFLRRHYTWECGIESLSCTVGDVVYLANDIFMAALGYGRIKDVKVENNQIVGVYLDESIEIHEGQTYGITIRTGAGDFVQKALFVAKNTGALTQNESDMVIPIKETQGASNYLEFETALPSNVDVMEGNLFIYQDAEKPGRKVLIESIKPNGDRGATITAVDYMEHLYDVDISTEIPEFVSNINKYGTGANVGTGYNSWTGEDDSAPRVTVNAVREYYLSSSKEELIGGTWTRQVPIGTGYLWYRILYIYSNGQTSTSQEVYPLKEVDVANPFDLKTQYGLSPDPYLTEESAGASAYIGATGTTEDLTDGVYLYYKREGEMLAVQWDATNNYFTILVTPDQTIPGSTYPTDFYNRNSKEYYNYNYDNVLVMSDLTYDLLPDTTYYYIRNLEGWSDVIPQSWQKGLHIWTRDIVTWENQPENVKYIAPVYSPELTENANRSCEFSIQQVGEYTWYKNMRSLDTAEPLSVNFTLKAVGYGDTLAPDFDKPFGNITGTYPNYTYTWQANTDADDITVKAILHYAYNGVVEDRTVAFNLIAVDTTEPAKYLGIITEAEFTEFAVTNKFFDGDHFLAKSNFTNPLPGTDIIPEETHLYVYTNGMWTTADATDTSTKYGDYSVGQIAFNAMYDVYRNPTYTYKEITDPNAKAEKGVSYYTYTGSIYEPVALAEDTPLNPALGTQYYTRELRIPAEVAKFYKTFQKVIAEYIGANDIELLDSPDGTPGRIRSTGYAKGTAQRIFTYLNDPNDPTGIDPDKVKPGFYGDNTGHFEAFKAWLVNVSMYDTDIYGRLISAAFETFPNAQPGDRYEAPVFSSNDAYWNKLEALAAVEARMTPYTFHTYESNYKGVHKDYAVWVNDRENTYPIQSSYGNPGVTYNMEFPSKITVPNDGHSEWYDTNGGRVKSEDFFAKGTPLKNRKRWAISALSENTDITANVINTSGCTWNGTALGYARVTNPQEIVASRYSTSHSSGNDSRYDDSWSFTIPNGFRNATMNFSGRRKQGRQTSWFQTLYRQGSMRISINGTSSYYIGATENGNVPFSSSLTVNAGDTITVAWGNAAGRTSTTDEEWGSISISITAQTFADQGMDTTGFYTCTITTKNGYTRVDTAINRSNKPIYYQEDTTDIYHEKAVVTLSSPSWSSADHLLSSALLLDYRFYNTGLNLVDTAYANPVSLDSDTFQRVADKSFEILDATDNPIYTSGNSANQYWHFSHLLDTTQDDKIENKGAVYSIYTNSVTNPQNFGFTRYTSYGASPEVVSDINDMTSVKWSNGQLTIITEEHGVFVINPDDFLKALTLTFRAIGREAGNYTISIMPKADDTYDLGTPVTNRYRRVCTDELYLGDSDTPFEVTPISNQFIDNLFV